MFFVPVVKMMRFARNFRTGNSQICNLCKNDYLPGQLVINRSKNVIQCTECEWEATYTTKVYPGEKSYTSYSHNNKTYRRQEGPFFKKPFISNATDDYPYIYDEDWDSKTTPKLQ
jgi:hypothetical protein